MPREKLIVLLLIGVCTLIRVAYGALTGLAYDEAYYWSWSRHPDYWYYDQAPWIAWSIKISSFLLGPTPIGVRALNILYAAGTALCIYNTADQWFVRRTALWTVVLLTVAPLLFAGGFLATYDGPQLFFWAAALYFLSLALHDEAPGWWYATGLVTFFGMLSKIPMVFFLLGALILLVWHQPYRAWLKTPHPYLAGLLALSALGLMWKWDNAHDHIYTLHTANLARRHMGVFPGRWLLDFIGGQIIALGPALFVGMVIGLFHLRRPVRGADDAARRFVLSMTLPMLAVCVVNSFRSKLEINWPVSAHLTGVMACALWLETARPRTRWIILGCAVPLLVLALFPGLPGKLGSPLPRSVGIKLVENYGWKETKARIDCELTELARDGRKVTTAAVNYRYASMLSFLNPKSPEAACLFFKTRRNNFWLWTKPEKLKGYNMLLVVDDDEMKSVEYGRKFFASVEELHPHEVNHPGIKGTLRKWRLFACRNFKGYDPNASVDGY